MYTIVSVRVIFIPTFIADTFLSGKIGLAYDKTALKGNWSGTEYVHVSNSLLDYGFIENFDVNRTATQLHLQRLRCISHVIRVFWISAHMLGRCSSAYAAGSMPCLLLSARDRPTVCLLIECVDDEELHRFVILPSPARLSTFSSRDDMWIDKGTRYFTIEFVIYSSNTGQFAVVQLDVDMRVTGS